VHRPALQLPNQTRIGPGLIRCEPLEALVRAALSARCVRLFLTKYKQAGGTCGDFVSFRQQALRNTDPNEPIRPNADCVANGVLYFQVRKRGRDRPLLETTGMGQGMPKGKKSQTRSKL
jgi:hypothetical protein